MSRDKIDDSPTVDDKGKSAEEKEHDERRERLHRWMKGVWRRN